MKMMPQPLKIHRLPAILERMAFIALLLLSLTFPFERMRPLIGLNGLVITNVEAVLLFGLGTWVLACLAARRWPLTPSRLALPVIAWLVVLLVSTMTAPSHRLEALKFIGRIVAGVLIGWAAYDLTNRAAGRWRLIVRALALSGLMVAVFGFAEAANVPIAMRFLSQFKFAPTVAGDIPRVSATLSYATIASMVLELTLPLLLAWTLTVTSHGKRGVLGLGLVIALAVQVLTLTRSGVIALFAAFSLMGVWAVVFRRRALLLGSVAAVATHLILIGVVLFANPLAKLRLNSETERLWYQVDYGAPLRLTAQVGETVTVPITLTNTGVRTWRSTGPNPFFLGYHLTHPDGSILSFESPRTILPEDVPPGGSVEVFADLEAPSKAGEYRIEWDMVQEGVTWFSFRGTPPSKSELTVVGTLADRTEKSAVLSQPALTLLKTPGRLDLWNAAVHVVRDRPLLGVGPDNFRWVYGSYVGLEKWDTRYHTNNLYIEWLVNTGILGLLVFLWLAWRVTQVVYHRLMPGKSRQGDVTFPESDLWYLAVAASLTTWFVHGLFDNFYEFTPTYVVFWLLIGLAVTESPSSRQEK